MAEEPEEESQGVEDEKYSLSSGDLAAEANSVDPNDYLALRELVMREMGLL